jgi:molybdate transport system substrate-binding protein
VRSKAGLAALLTSLLVLSSLAACGSTGEGAGSGGDSNVTLHVFAAASLTEAFTTLGKQFEKDHPGTDVALNFGPSSGLAEQITGGAPADVFASASPTNMDTLVRSGDASNPRDFARNSGEIAVPPDNPAGISSVADLAAPGVKVAVCQPQVPCGKVATEVFSRSAVTVKPATEEVDVKSVLTKVTLGEVDAGLVYVTDVQAAGDKVKGIVIPDDQNSVTSYPIARLEGSRHEREAGEFIDLVLSADGAKVLTDAGFAQP